MCRVLALTVRMDEPTEQFYWLDLELSPQTPLPVLFPAFCCLTWTSDVGAAGTHMSGWVAPVAFYNSGDGIATPGSCLYHSGDPSYPNGTPTSGLLSKIATGFGTGKPCWSGVLVGGTGTIDVTATTSVVMVGFATPVTVTWAIYLNGVSVAAVSQTLTSGSSWSPVDTVSITGLAVVPGDIIEFWWTSTYEPTGNIPSGTGSSSNRMVVTGDLG